jgi:hypothetical protein
VSRVQNALSARRAGWRPSASSGADYDALARYSSMASAGTCAIPSTMT